MASITTVSFFLRTPSLDLFKKAPVNSLLPRDFENKKHLIHGCSYSQVQTYNPKHVSAISTSDFTVTDKAFRGFDSLSGDFNSGNGGQRGGSQEAVPSGAGSEEIAIDKLDIPPQLIESLKKRGITSLFPIQRAVLVPALQGRNLIARAKTGTGKTLAFGIPILKNLIEDGFQSHPGRTPRALVLAPTRELAKQVEKELKESAPYFSTACIYGGVSQITQQNSLSLGVDIVVGTPGRIIDLVQNNILKLSKIKYFVLDEADQMLDVGFEEAVETILGNLPKQRQNMLFSATMPSWVKNLSGKYLDNPMTIDLVGDEEDKVPQGIKLLAVEVPTTAKRTILSDLIVVYAKGGKTIVFTQTKVDADDVSSSLTNKILAEPLHGDITQHQRERTLNGFRSGRFTVLVATDVAARGLDISDVDLVIHYDLPNVSETFVHRSGRTGRAGKEGTSVLMFAQSQGRTVKFLERDVSCKFEHISPPSIEDVLESSAQQVVASLGRVHPTSVQFFSPIATKIISEQGPNALAAAFAHLSGFSNPPSCRSLITHEQEWLTLQFELNSGFLGGFVSNQTVTKSLSEVHPFAADEVRNINLIAHEKIQGAVFDLPEEIAKEVLSKKFPSGITISKISKLPPLQEVSPPTDFYGSSYSGRGQNSRGRFSGRRGGMRAGRNWAGNSGKRGGFDDDDDDDGYNDDESVFSRRGRQNSRFSQKGAWSPRPSGRTNRFSGYGSPDRQSAERCFNCGGFGHTTLGCSKFNRVSI